MNQLTRLVLPVYAVNAILSLLGFALSISHFGMPHVLLHPLSGTLWTVLIFTQIVLAAKHHPMHKVIGRFALMVLGVSVYAALSGLAMNIGSENAPPFPNSVLFVFVVTGIATIVYASMGIGFAVHRNYEAHSTAMLLASAVTMAAGIARLAGALEAIIGIPFQLTYSLSVLSMAFVLWRWRPSEYYLIGSYLVLMGCVIFLR
jgi:hypothetical protein